MKRASLRFPLALAGLCSLAGAQTDAIPQPGEKGFQYPLNALLPCESGDRGWKLLFDGRSRESFAEHFTYRFHAAGDTALPLPSRWTYRSQDSAIVTEAVSPDIRTRFQAGDFELRFSYKNSGVDGVVYKARNKTGPYVPDPQFAIQDNLSANPKHKVGALFDIFAPDSQVSRVYRPWNADHGTPSTWNFVRIVAKGDSVEHWLNNVRVLRYRFWDANWRAAISKWSGSSALSSIFAQDIPGCQCTIREGYLGFVGDHDGTWLLRNIRLNTDSASIRLGPAGGDCATSLAQGPAPRIQSLERVPGGLRLRLAASISKARVHALDGREMPARLEGMGDALFLRHWTPGIHVLRLWDPQGRESAPARVFLP